MLQKREKRPPIFGTYFIRSTHSVGIPLAYSNSMPEYAKGMLRVWLHYAKGMAKCLFLIC